jgi:hypothetical protein
MVRIDCAQLLATDQCSIPSGLQPSTHLCDSRFPQRRPALPPAPFQPMCEPIPDCSRTLSTATYAATPQVTKPLYSDLAFCIVPGAFTLAQFAISSYHLLSNRRQKRDSPIFSLPYLFHILLTSPVSSVSSSFSSFGLLLRLGYKCTLM